MKANLPNLELLEYQATLDAKKNKNLMDTLKKHYEKQGFKNVFINLDVEVFPQTWGSTCTAFDVCSDGSPAIGGCAMTKAYTCVFHEPISNTYFVFVDGRICYQVDNATPKFLKDLKNRNLEPLSMAREVY